MEYTQIKYSDEIENKLFPLQKEEYIRLIVLDTANLYNGKSFETEDDKILNFISEQKKSTYDFIITKTGKIYKLSPDNKCGTFLKLDLYSEFISRLLPDYCPQTDGSIYPHKKTPDQIAISILIECDNDPLTNIDCGVLTDYTKESLEDLIAYYMNVYGISSKYIIGRNKLPKMDSDVKRFGPSFMKNDSVTFILIISYAMAISRNDPNIELIKSFDLDFESD